MLYNNDDDGGGGDGDDDDDDDDNDMCEFCCYIKWSALKKNW